MQKIEEYVVRVMLNNTRLLSGSGKDTKNA
jgi:hypothetical protein